MLEGDNQYNCDFCQTKKDALRFTELQKDELPPFLTLQLMRFVYDAKTMNKKKLKV